MDMQKKHKNVFRLILSLFFCLCIVTSSISVAAAEYDGNISSTETKEETKAQQSAATDTASSGNDAENISKPELFMVIYF